MAEINYYADHIIQGTLSTSGTVSLGGTLTVQNGNINLGSGTGRIQGVDTVSASTDAANKAYVDAHPAGTVTGTGVSDRVAFWTGTSSLSNDSRLHWDSTNDRLGIGTSTPSSKLHIYANNDNAPTVVTIENGDIGVSAGQDLAQINFLTNDASAPGAGIAASIRAVCQNAGNIFDIAFNVQNGSTRTERMRLDGAGKLGIGTTDPQAMVDIEGMSTIVPALKVNAVTGDNMILDIYNSSNVKRMGIEYDNSGINFNIVNRNTDKLFTVREGGNVGVGTASPLEKFQVAGNAAIYGAIKGYTGSSSNQYLSILQSGTQTFISTGTTGETVYFGIGPVTNVTNISIAGTATATNFILSSDKTLKDKIKNIKANHVDVKWKNFELISEPGVKRSGVIAQELEEKHPEFVRTDKDGLKSVAYIDLLITKIAELEARLKKAGL